VVEDLEDPESEDGHLEPAIEVDCLHTQYNAPEVVLLQDVQFS